MVTIGGDQDLIISGDLEILSTDTTQLTIANASGAVTWSSGTVGVATVGASTGLVSGVAAGTTVITATDAAGKTATVTVTVV